jgi:surface-anchored protein
MKRDSFTLLTSIVVLAASTGLNAQTNLNMGDTDIGIGYDAGWDLHVHKENPPNTGEYEPADALLQVNGQAETTVPVGSQWSFLGTAGSPVWILPQSEDPNLLFLGIGTEEIAPGIFVGEEVTLSLSSVTGPGNFSTYSESLGVPNVLFDSSDGITGADSFTLPTGTHQHFNFAFTAPGDYTIALEGSGTLVAGSTFTESGSVDYFFTVTPEPSSTALAGLGLFSLLCSVCARRRAAR